MTRIMKYFNAILFVRATVVYADFCMKVEITDGMRMEAKDKGSHISFRCVPGFELVGNDSIYCNGSHWSAPVPKCVEKTRNLSCDFEKKDLCGWTHDQEGDFDWTWDTGTTPTQGTGPSYDHTLGPNKQGHYLFLETSAPNKFGDKAILKSPSFMPHESSQCFGFWYHSYGSGLLSKLEVYVWMENETKEDLSPKFTLNQLTGRQWQNKIFYVPQLNETFQIIFIGTRLKGHKHDIAIDDVSLGPCPGNMSSSTMTIIMTKEPATRVNPPATVAEMTAKQTNSTTMENGTKKMSSKSTSEKDISPLKTALPNFNNYDTKPGVTFGFRTMTADFVIQNSVHNKQKDTKAVYITVGVVAMVAVIAILSTVYYIHQRRRKAKYNTEEMESLHNPTYNADLENQNE